MRLYANIIIDISQGKLDKTFQYAVPEQMRDQLTVGAPVIVPFGNGGRTIKGFVVELTTTAEYDPAKIKEIQSLDTDAMPIESQLVTLAAWIRKHYGGTMNHALKTVIPIRQKTAEKEKKVIHLLLDKEQAMEQLLTYRRKHNTARERLLEALITQPELAYEVVTQKLHITANVIRALEEQCILRVERYRSYRNPANYEQDADYALALNPTQQEVVSSILKNAASDHPKTCLIHGVTGSGKTEVYMELIADAVAKGKQSIVLIPEIALTYQTVMRFQNRFGDRVSILNSKMSAGERFDQFERAKNGQIDVMIGPRSALFTPFSNLGYIIIDEEHEASYKSETVPRYHARETAIERARMAGATVVLGSATPSIDSYYKAVQGEYLLFEMTKRAVAKQLPVCYVVDLREELKEHNYSILSRKLEELMEDRLQKKEQIMLFLNRRGMSGFVSCRSCGYVIKCPHCDVSLSAHKNGRLVCHYCGYEREAADHCPSCGSPHISGFKAGTQKIELLVHKRFPQARILRMDTDTTKNKDGHEKILSAFANYEADILIGTQMIVKGHDFANVTLVGVLAADLSLHVGDYRASERTFQLLTQAAGRAGRGDKVGEVVIQTYDPSHYSIVAAAAQDYNAFYKQEIAYRSMLKYPPVWNMLVILLSSAVEDRCIRMAGLLARIIENTKKNDTTDRLSRLQIIGPTEPAVAKVNDIYKRVLYLKHPAYDVLVQIKDAIETYMEKNRQYQDILIQFDFNPMNGF